MSPANHESPLRATLAGLRDLLRPRARLQLADDERLDGRVVMITGGNRGLGFGVAELLARRGARLILACRSGGPEAAAALRFATNNPEIEALPVDLSERASVAALVDALADRQVTLDRLILNAAVVPLESRTTSAGLDVMFHVNFLAAVDLVERLLERELIGSNLPGSPARIVVVSSEAHRSGQPQPLDRLGEPERYGTSGVLARYGRNKLYLTSYAWALADALDPAKIGVFVLCPGAVASDLAREAPRWMRVLLDPTMRRLFQSPRVAAEPVVWLSCARELDGQTRRYLHMHTPKPPAAWAADPRNGEALRVAARELLAKL
jgi:NAD(P)-dependent dehydrogenase (short-subunit alcohol dehydrogenase family)